MLTHYSIHPLYSVLYYWNSLYHSLYICICLEVPMSKTEKKKLSMEENLMKGE